MSGECEKCGEHCLECRCINEEISAKIQAKIEPIYEKFKSYPNELIDAFERFIEEIDIDAYSRLFDEHVQRLGTRPSFNTDSLIFNFWPFSKKNRKALENEDIKEGYICRVCATRLNAVPPKNHVCTWFRGKCEFCGETANLCHTSDWNWPDLPHLEEDREF